MQKKHYQKLVRNYLNVKIRLLPINQTNATNNNNDPNPRTIKEAGGGGGQNIIHYKTLRFI